MHVTIHRIVDQKLFRETFDNHGFAAQVAWHAAAFETAVRLPVLSKCHPKNPGLGLRDT